MTFIVIEKPSWTNEPNGPNHSCRIPIFLPSTINIASIARSSGSVLHWIIDYYSLKTHFFQDWLSAKWPWQAGTTLTGSLRFLISPAGQCPPLAQCPLSIECVAYLLARIARELFSKMRKFKIKKWDSKISFFFKFLFVVVHDVFFTLANEYMSFLQLLQEDKKKVNGTRLMKSNLSL